MMDTKELRGKAAAAYPGPWEAEVAAGRGSWIKAANGYWCALSCGEHDDDGEANAAYIAAASPSVILSLLDEVEGLRKAGGWQPIETAPQDGTEIILGGCKGGSSVRVGHWGAGRFNRKTKGYDRDWADGASWGFDPTHWQPLPPPSGDRS